MNTRPTLLALTLLCATAAHAAAPAAPAASSRPLACTDFDAYVNDEWNRTTELPPDRARIGSFDILRRANDQLLTRALTELVAEPARQTTPGLRHLATAYRAGMDEAAIERAGLSAIAPWLARIAAAPREQLPELLGELAALGADLPVRPFVGSDLLDATRHLVALQAGGLGLPDRDDYTRTEASSQRLREGYRRFASTVMQAAGTPMSEPALDALLALEAQIAQAHLTPVQRRNPQALNNRRTVASLQAEAPGLDWGRFLAAWSGGARFTDFNVAQPAVARAFAQAVQTAPLDTWRAYLRLRLIEAYAPMLPQAFEQAHFAWTNGVIRGIPTPPPRSERVIASLAGPNGSAPLGEALGELYVAKAYSPEAQRRALAMVADIREAMRRRIQALPWMSAPTKAAALVKLEAMVPQIGHPAQWRTYAGLEIRDGDFAGNQLRTQHWWLAQRLAELDKPVDRTRWNTSANTVNAFAAGGNRIVFPAGILQPPFFDEKADDASNYGAIGTVIGHEITHHFDDRGRQFDAVGNLRDWWAPEDAAAYKARAEKVAQLYSTFEPLPGVRINGHQMLGENISDFGGIHIAFDGLQIALERRRKAGEAIPLVEGRTAEQRFFIANAVIWRGKQREAALLNQLRTGQHSPGRWRVLGPISHQPAFAKAFGCKPGDPMAAVEPILVW
jgi:predicted metalloendopeptidase